MVQDGNLVLTETVNELNQITASEGGGMMRFAGTITEAASVTVGGNPAKVSRASAPATGYLFEGYAAVETGKTNQVHIVAKDTDLLETDRYVEITPDAVVAQSFTYDDNGNTLTSGPTGAPDVEYGWDAADRLISVTQGGNVTTFEYDGASRRVRENSNFKSTFDEAKKRFFGEWNCGMVALEGAGRTAFIGSGI